MPHPFREKATPRYLDAGPVVRISRPSGVERRRRGAGFLYNSHENQLNTLFAACERLPRGLKLKDQVALYGHRYKTGERDYVSATYVFDISAWLRDGNPSVTDVPDHPLRVYTVARIGWLQEQQLIKLPEKHARIFDEVSGRVKQERLEKFGSQLGPQENTGPPGPRGQARLDV